MLEMLKNHDADDLVVRARGLHVLRWQFARMIQEASRALRRQGLNPGDRVLLLLPNSLELLVYYYGCLAAGLVAVPVNTRQAPAEVQAIFEDSRPALTVYDDDAWDARLAGHNSPKIRAGVIEHLPDQPPEVSTAPQWPGHHPAIIYYTSGSTGAPKGVVYSHATLRNNSRMCRAQYGIEAQDRSVLCHCLAHNFVFSQLAMPLLDAGGSVHIVDFGSVEQTVQALQEGATILKLIPWFALELFQFCKVNGIRPTGLRLCMIGGDRVPLEAFDLCRSAMGIGASQNIGMTETNSYCADMAGSKLRKRGSVGLPLPGVEIEVRDKHGLQCKAGQRGQIWVRSPAMMVGYWRNEEATRDTLVDGWIATGDLGHFDEHGVLWFDSRKRHIIIHDGDNIVPVEVEAAIAQHPAVERVVVLGIPHPTHGELVAAAFTVHDPCRLDTTELESFLKPLLSESKVPALWLQLDELPNSSNGKLDIKALKAAFSTPQMNPGEQPG